ncbi:MAG: N-acetylmuramoyl-L-alanine amidase [Ruminococcaceae bacterium]|nr:N-acetylmuramoyl-L-alanine amidase [Oscillospiraceae bacterium]
MPIKIYIDQGHNPSGFNTGAEGNGFFEQDITFEIGRRLYNLLRTNPEFTPRLSRPTADTILGTSNSTSLTTRVNEANAWPADVFISLHNNAAANPNATGNEALVYGPGATVARGLGEEILEQLTLTTGLRNRGIVYRPGLYVLKETTMPAVLVEMGFISNPYDAELLAYSPDLFATGIYRGILAYYDLL